MKTLYLECNMGAAGDMLMGALVELLPEPEVFLQKFDELQLPNVTIKKQKVSRCGITGTHMVVSIDGQEEESQEYDLQEHPHGHGHVHPHGHGQEHGHKHSNGHGHGQEHSHGHRQEHPHGHGHVHPHGHKHSHSHTGIREIEKLVEEWTLSDKVKQDIKQVYRILAKAEAYVHGRSIEEIHFHEVGTLDAIADVTAVCMLMEQIGPQKIVTSPIHVGKGMVHCAHGILPIPAPATAYILKNVPIYSGAIRGELCTPTGAALLKYFTQEYGGIPMMTVEKIGYGMGKKEFAAANCVRAMLGESG